MVSKAVCEPYGHPGVCWPIKPMPYWVKNSDGEYELHVKNVIQVFRRFLHIAGFCDEKKAAIMIVIDTHQLFQKISVFSFFSSISLRN